MSESSIIVATVSGDLFHLEQAMVLIKSLAENSPNDRIRLHVVDGGDLNIGNIHPLCEIVKTSLGIPEMNKKKIPGVMSCHRTTIVKEALEIHDRVAYIDCDVIVREDLSDFWSDVIPNTIKVMHRPKADLNCRFQAGIFALGKSENVIRYIEKYDRMVQGNVYFLAEQQMLYESWIGSGVDLVELDGRFNDWHFDDQSAIWHCKANHFHETKYQLEYKRYLDLAYASILQIPE